MKKLINMLFDILQAIEKALFGINQEEYIEKEYKMNLWLGLFEAFAISLLFATVFTILFYILTI